MWFHGKNKNKNSTKKVKGIKINLNFIFNNFPVHRTGLQLVSQLNFHCKKIVLITFLATKYLKQEVCYIYQMTDR